jgi:hypothetical protein
MTGSDTPSRFQKSQKTMLWTRACLLILGVSLLILAVMLVSLYTADNCLPLKVPPQRINPNTASMASLVRLPGIGKARALDIIHYRQSQKQRGPVFLSANDLQAIRGIGPKTAAKLEPWLVFDESEAHMDTNKN